MANNYITNADFLAAILKYKEECAEYRKGNPDPKARPKTRTYEYIGKCILDITTKLTNHPRFRGYSFKEEFTSDGYMDCIKHMENFNPDITKNPFGYFTQIAWFAAYRRIGTEQKQQDIKGELIKNSSIVDELKLFAGDGDDSDAVAQMLTYLMDNYEKSRDSTDKSHIKTTKKHQENLKNGMTVGKLKKLTKAHNTALKKLDEKIITFEKIGEIVFDTEDESDILEESVADIPMDD